MYSRMSWLATCGLMRRGAQHGRGRLMRPKRASSANMMRSRRPRRAPARLFVGGLEIVDVQQFARSRRLGKARQQGLLRGQRHVLAHPSADRLRFKRFDAAMVVGHVGAIHGTQRNPHGGRNRRLRHPTLAQQYYLDALTLLRRHLPPQCRFQSPDLALAAFDHLFPRIRCSTGNHRNRLTLGTQLPQIADSISYGVGISVWETLDDAKQMALLQAMLDLAKTF